MTFNNSICVIIALQESTTAAVAAAAACCRDRGIAIKRRQRLRSADQGKSLTLHVLLHERRKNILMLQKVRFFLDWWETLSAACTGGGGVVSAAAAAAVSATCYFLKICFSIVPPPRPWFRTSQMSRLHICNSKLARSNVITLFVIPRFEFHNERVGEEERKKKRKHVWLLSKSMSFNQPSAPLWRERAFTCIWRPLSAAKWLIITSLMC